MWKPLPLSPTVGNQLPTLLIATSFTKDAYTIHLTDLTNIWSESLGHAAILSRSLEENTSIDPTDDDQLAILLEKLQHSVREGSSDTILTLAIHNSDNDRPALTLNITVDLPSGLAPLQWPVHLAAAPQTLFTSQMVLPLLRSQHARLREIASLKEVVAEKDHVIQKVVDKLEAQGTDLAEVFPQAAAVKGRKADRRRAEGRVKGLAIFEEETWRKSLGGEEELDIGKLNEEIFGGGDLEVPTSKVSKHVGFEDDENWWEAIQGIHINLKNGKFSTRSPTKAKSRPQPQPPQNPSIPKDDTEDSAFQVQATPSRKPPAPKESTPPSRPNHYDDTTDDEDDLDAPSQVSKVPDSFNTQPALRSRSPKASQATDALGGKKSSPKRAPPKKSAPPPRPPNEETDSDATEDESPQPPPSRRRTSALRTKSPSPLPSPPPKRVKLGKIGTKPQAREKTHAKEPTPDPPPKQAVKAKTPTPATKTKLGKIGGKKKAVTPSPELEHEDEPVTEAIPSKRKLGGIGRHVRTSTPVAEASSHDHEATEKKQAMEEDGERGRRKAKEVKEEMPLPRETSEERANRKREELRKELEEKARAPVRKKRKF